MATQTFIKYVFLIVLFRERILFGSGVVILGLIGFDFSSMAILLSMRPWD